MTSALVLKSYSVEQLAQELRNIENMMTSETEASNRQKLRKQWSKVALQINARIQLSGM